MSHAAHSAIFPPAAPLDFNRFYASSGLIFSASTGSPSGVAHFLSDPHVDPDHFEGGCNALMRAVLYGDADSVALLAPKTDLMARSELGNRHTDGDKTALRIAVRALVKNTVARGKKFQTQTQIVETIAAHMTAEALDAQFRAAALEGSFREAETLSLHAADRAITETFSALVAKSPKSKAPERMPQAFARFERLALSTEAGVRADAMPPARPKRL